MIRALLTSRARMLRRDFFAPPVKRGWPRHPAFAVLLAVLLALLVRAGLGQAFSALTAAGGEAARTGLLALTLTGALVALLAFDVDDVVRTLLLDPDLDLLRRAPRPAPTLLAIKALDAAPRTLLPLLVLAAPSILVFLSGRSAPAAGAVAAGVALFFLWAMALAAGVALSLGVLRFVPAARAREALGMISTVVFLAIWVVGTLLLPRALAPGGSPGHALAPTIAVAALGVSPSAAAARAIASASAGDGLGALGELAFLASLGAVSFVLVGLAGRFALAGALERIAGASVVSARQLAPRVGRVLPWRREGVLAAILRRDARMLRRSWTILGDLFIASAMWALLPLVGFARGEIEWSSLVRLALMTIAIGLGYEVGARSIPFERRAGFWARVTPVGRRRYCAAKLAGATLVSAPIVLVLGTVMFAFARVSPGDSARFAVLTAGALVLSQSTGVWAGAVFGDPDWVNPRAMLRFSGRMVAALLVILQLAIWVGISYGLDALGAGFPAWAGAGLAGAACALLPTWAASRRIAESDSRH